MSSATTDPVSQKINVVRAKLQTFCYGEALQFGIAEQKG